MKQILVIVAALSYLYPGGVWAQNANDKTAAYQTIQNIADQDVVAAARPLNEKVDYIADVYDSGDLRNLIRNYEKTNKKIAERQGKAYVPYDQRIDVENPQKVKRYLRKRIDIVF